jgi:hypothetical protein
LGAGAEDVQRLKNSNMDERRGSGPRAARVLEQVHGTDCHRADPGLCVSRVLPHIAHIVDASP